MPTIYFAITNHGFGHATRTASVIAELQKQRPDIKIIIATTAPLNLLSSYIPGDFVYHPRSFDVGVVQQDSIQMDRSATLAKMNQIWQQQAQIIAEEVEFIRANQVDLIFADIPPLVAAIAKAAEIPCWMAGNFGWDFIYRDWGKDHGTEYFELADRVAELYSKCDRLFRLPFAEPMTSFSNATIADVGLTGGKPRYSALEIQQRFQLDRDRQTILLTFGGLGLSQIPYENLAKFADRQFITFDRHAPDLPNLLKIKEQDEQLRPVDMMVACDRVVSKPGYSTLAEALRVGLPVICMTREGFVEAQTLIAGVQDYAKHAIISPQEFYEGDWQFLDAPLQPPRQSKKLDLHGEVAIARAIIEAI
jgi:UDP:flavonoid glycosyltransferase YjiC (YdhE family)